MASWYQNLWPYFEHRDIGKQPTNQTGNPTPGSAKRRDAAQRRVARPRCGSHVTPACTLPDSLSPREAGDPAGNLQVQGDASFCPFHARLSAPRARRYVPITTHTAYRTRTRLPVPVARRARSSVSLRFAIMTGREKVDSYSLACHRQILPTRVNQPGSSAVSIDDWCWEFRPTEKPKIF